MEAQESQMDKAFVEEATQMREVWTRTLPQSLLDREEALPAVIKAKSASRHVKYGMIIKLVDEVLESKSGFVGCKKGCSHCCRMNVQITPYEAERITSFSGERAATITQSIHHDIATFNGHDCPFLVNSICAVYEVRPIVCRTHVAFGKSDYACQPGKTDRLLVPMSRMTGIEEAFYLALGGKSGLVLADIRDFFHRKVACFKPQEV